MQCNNLYSKKLPTNPSFTFYLMLLVCELFIQLKSNQNMQFLLTNELLTRGHKAMTFTFLEIIFRHVRAVCQHSNKLMQELASKIKSRVLLHHHHHDLTALFATIMKKFLCNVIFSIHINCFHILRLRSKCYSLSLSRFK